jgi:hypothetical protein
LPVPESILPTQPPSFKGPSTHVNGDVTAPIIPPFGPARKKTVLQVVSKSQTTPTTPRRSLDICSAKTPTNWVSNNCPTFPSVSSHRLT